MAVGQGFRVHYLINVNDARLRGYHRFLVVQRFRPRRFVARGVCLEVSIYSDRNQEQQSVQCFQPSPQHLTTTQNKNFA